MGMSPYVLLLRPHHYIKNLFIFLPLIFGLKALDFYFFTQTAFAFIAFSLVGSSVYIFNDYFDIASDRLHPIKKNRPLASGTVSVKSAVLIGAACLSAGLLIAVIQHSYVFYLILGYVALNVAYTVILKHVSIIDMTIIAFGFIIRIFVGSVVSSTPLSMWIIIMTFLLAFFLSLSKRRADVVLNMAGNLQTRKVIDGYNLQFLDGGLFIMASVILVSYVMYTVSPQVVAQLGFSHLYFTGFFVLLGILRYLQLVIVKDFEGCPTRLLIRDRYLQIVILFWFLSVFYGLYF